MTMDRLQSYLRTFIGTVLNQVLCNLGLDEVIVGFYTDQCVSMAARDAADLGYDTLVVEDAIMALKLENHESALEQMRDVCVRHCTITELIEKIMSL